MEQFDTLPIQCRHIEHMHEGVYNFCLHRFYRNLRLLVRTITCQVFSLTLTVRGVSNKHCLLTVFIETKDTDNVNSNYLKSLVGSLSLEAYPADIRWNVQAFTKILMETKDTDNMNSNYLISLNR